jgi:hypothetical protein
MPSRSAGLLKILFMLAVLSVAMLCALLALGANWSGIAPRSLGPYIERRSMGHNPLIEKTGVFINRSLQRLDRGAPLMADTSALRIGAQPQAESPAPAPSSSSSGGQRVVFVASAADTVKALNNAAPGDLITILPGTYRFRDVRLNANKPGTALRPITVTATVPGTVRLEFEIEEGFNVSAPYWVFENLQIRGVCADHRYCEHAFHVTGNARHFISRNNLTSDFNAHYKINGSGGAMPDDGLIENGTLRNTAIRGTRNPVNGIDLVAASNWVVRKNLIADLIKGEGDRVSYGAYFKGGGRENRFERNIVLCEQALQGHPGQRVGLSLGGGGSGAPFCRDRKCITEQDAGVIEANLIASCSDVGIYVNKSAMSRITHNTLLDTAGIDVRFPESSADIDGNLIDGRIHARNDGVVRPGDNIDSAAASIYLGWHRVRRLFNDTASMDLSWRDGAPARSPGAPALDLCSDGAGVRPHYGAFGDFSACQRSMASATGAPRGQ